MEEKVKRETKSFLENLFKKYDKVGAGAVSRQDMRSIMDYAIPDFSDELELDELINKHAKDTKYTELNKQTKQMEVKYQKDSVDFPSALAIIVHFLLKIERKASNAFAGKGLVRFNDFPAAALNDPDKKKNRRLF